MSMDLEYEWQRYGSDRKGGKLSFSLMIICTRWFKTEKVPFRLVDGSGQLPPKDGYVELKAGKSVHIDYDTYDWDWCNGDYIIIFDSKGREYDRQVFRLRTYVPGECPECHGSHLCAACKGTGRISDKLHMISTCPRCLGTGVCQTCYVPLRSIQLTYGSAAGASYNSTSATNTNPNAEASRYRKIDALRQRIYELQQNIDRMEWEERTNNMRTAMNGTPTYSTFTTQSSRLRLKYEYQRQLLQLQSELEQLEREGLK